jgi:hypothetical protein
MGREIYSWVEKKYFNIEHFTFYRRKNQEFSKINDRGNLMRRKTYYINEKPGSME